MTTELPSALQAYVPGVGHACQSCGRLVVDAVETEGEPFRCADCQGPAMVTEDELTRTALEDRAQAGVSDDRPTTWRLIALLVFAIVALSIVFWKR
jgi:hypothetical protein